MTSQPSSLNAAIELCAANGDISAYRYLAESWLPILPGLARLYFDKDCRESVEHCEAVCRDTLLLAWRNRRQIPADDTPSQWLCRIFGSVLYNRLVAVHGGEPDMLQWLGTRHGSPLAMMASPTGPRPALFGGEQLAKQAGNATPEASSQQLQQQTERLIQAEIDQCSAPRTPTGERAHPLLYDPAIRRRMLRSRIAFIFNRGFKRYLGRPLEDWLFRRWLSNKPGSAVLERKGLMRRSVEAYLGDKLDIQLDPYRLQRGLNYPASFPDRTLRRAVSNLFLWSGDWDLPTPLLAETSTQHFVSDIWQHRLNLSNSDSYAELLMKLEQQGQLRMHHQGILLNSPERILDYLNHYRFYIEDMSCFGFKAEQGKDRLGVAIDRNGSLIKIRQGLHRIAMAQTLGIQRITVRVKAVHQNWWQCQTEGAKGKEAMRKLSNSIAEL